MLANNKRSLLKVLASGFCAITTLAALTADINAETVGSCLYSAQLASDPALRAAFTNQINAIKTGLPEVSDEDGAIYVTDIPAGGSTSGSSGSFADPVKSIDSLSNGCLSCHDGIMAKSFNVRIKNDPNGRVMSLVDIIGGHPVGMEYENYASVNGKEYRGEVKLSNEMVFADGKVGCLTCHNPLNSSKGHLVMTNERSELCFSCHKK